MKRARLVSSVTFAAGALTAVVARGQESQPNAPTATRPVEQPGNPVPPAAAAPIPRPAPPALNPTPEASAEAAAPDRVPEPSSPAQVATEGSTGKPTDSAPESADAGDELPNAGYIPGYRAYPGLGISAYAPRLGTLPGGVTPSFGAPTPPEDWNFTWSGYMSASLISSIGKRRVPAGEGQTETVFHSPQQTVDEWQSFTGTNPVQGSWVGMNLLYGSQLATAQVSIATWNPTRPVNSYSIGSQYFINDAFLRIRAPALGGVRLSWNIGYFSQNYGNLGRYGGGLYTNPITAQIQGVGETTIAEYDFSDTLVGIVEHGIMGNRNGGIPQDAPSGTGAAGGGSVDSMWLATWTHHAHLGLLIKGEVQYQFQLHYLTQWSQDDRSQLAQDDFSSREIDESYIRDGRLRVFGADARVIHPVYGLLAIGGAYVMGNYAYPMKGLNTYGGDGERLTNSWWGDSTTGSGTLFIAGINYQASLGRIVTHPEPFPGDHPDVNFDVGCHLATTTTDYQTFDGRLRYKCGGNALYTFLSFLGVGGRFDTIVPNSKEPEETFHSLAARIQFKTDWNSREAINLHYVKWFYGPRTRSDANYPRLRDELDDQLFGLNFNMWW